MPKVDRLERVNELIKRELADRIERSGLLDTQGMLLSVTGVKASVDLRTATVFVSIFGGDNAKRAHLWSELLKLRGDLQKDLARTLAFKFTPVLNFVRDERIEKGDRILEILNGGEEGEHAE